MKQFAHFFKKAARERGREYFERGRVTLRGASDDSIEARVKGSGSRVYRVAIEIVDQSELITDCSCPFAYDHLEPCKHVWATLLAAEDEGVFSSVRDLAPWQTSLREAANQMLAQPLVTSRTLFAKDDVQVAYVLDASEASYSTVGPILEVTTRRRNRRGELGIARRAPVDGRELLLHPDPRHRLIGQMLVGAPRDVYHSPTRFALNQIALRTLLPLLCESGCFYLRRDGKDSEPVPVTWDDGPPWRFVLTATRAKRGSDHEITGEYRRGDERMALSEPDMVLRGGVVFAHGRAARLDDRAFDLLAKLGPEAWKVSAEEVEPFLTSLYSLPELPELDLGDALRVEEVSIEPHPVLKIGKPQARTFGGEKLPAHLLFRYGDTQVPAEPRSAAAFDAAGRKVYRRDAAAEQAASNTLQTLGFRYEWSYEDNGRVLQLPPAKLPAAVAELTGKGWRVEAEGRAFRSAGAISVDVSTGIDWFDLDARVDFDGTSVPLPRLLEAVRKGAESIILDDGSVGLVPLEWLNRYAKFAALGREVDGRVRFASTQAAVMDALLAAEPHATFDEGFVAIRKRLASFEGVGPAEPPAGFVGELRPYQREGLGWLGFLQEFGFGGCLADDMGLGKTVQVLALLEARREAGHGPSLVVVPRSLLFNWRQEAARFTPRLRVLDQTGRDRIRDAAHLAGHDLILTTYGTLRRDAAFFKDVTFDYAILDEAQAIKNPSTASAKAARLLRANHRLALSGTPVENRLAELWSLIEFLNPGMLGSASVFKSLIGPAGAGQGSSLPGSAAAGGAGGSGGSGGEADGLAMVGRALRPFILRRTKAQVATDLPEKLEQTLTCELGPKQRKLYNELRDHYRASLLGRIDKVGLKRSKIMVLEALLRLRQAACHPALIDPKHAAAGSVKLDALWDQLTGILAEGHKALVFSQFTSLLGILRERLDAEQIRYEYLDGKTRKRQERVERFQNDAGCPLFLISLKAGGVGLNLTAADYVFLLDPWWNPAVEAQAIDRTHRIGQTRRVFACRLVAQDTVEEKVLALQERKRRLADAIITADNSILADLSREDLALLLS